MNQKVWGGRFKGETDALVNSFNSSIAFDRRLYSEDIRGSVAHCRMLAKQGIITEDESGQIVEALGKIKRRLDRGEYALSDDYEDIHGFVEKTLVDEVGHVGEKLHTARSRNDQVALDMRMYIKDKAVRAGDLIKGVQSALVELAEKNVDLVMPGYTHLQRAQPVLLAHHLLAYYEMLKRDRARFRQTWSQANIMPLGSAALAGSTFDLDRDMVAEELGFEGVSENSMDAVSDRDFVLEFLFSSSVLMMHLSRLSEELILWSSAEFGFLTISDSFSTGSSIMPQKKNPDIPELIRGKTGRVYGHLMSLLTTMKGLPLAYNKDMQEDKEALFDAVDTVGLCLEVLGRFLGEISFDAGRMKAATEKGFLVATDLADYLVRKGKTFRDAHEVVGRMVLQCADQGRELSGLTLKEMKAFSRRIEDDVFDWLDPARSTAQRDLRGGTGPRAVQEALERAGQELKS